MQRTGSVAVGLALAQQFACSASRTALHPRILLTQESLPDLRSINDVRASIDAGGYAAEIWQRLLQKAELDLNAAPLTPSSMFPGRSAGAAKHNNPDYTVCHAAGQRILRSSLIHLLVGQEAHKRVALEQMESLFDPTAWKAWIDQSHVHFGHAADLRTGMLSHDVALAYDWLYLSLSKSEREFVVEGLDRCGIQPYLSSLDQDPWWVHDMNNWLTVIVGGLGVAGMVLEHEHPDAKRLIAYSQEKMDAYMRTYGDDGEFNESVAYSNATRLPAAYYMIQLYWSSGGENRLAAKPFPQTCRWMMYNTLPPGRVAKFGDSHAQPPEVRFFTAVASATRDPLLQWFYLHHAKESADPFEFLWYDDRVPAKPPEAGFPLGKAFAAHGMTVSSRTSWDLAETDCVVYGKAGREENHEHNDIGQVCIDGFGESLIVDLGSPSGYPADFFENETRWQYYNAGIIGHNVLQFGEREMRSTSQVRAAKDQIDFTEYSGRFLATDFDNRQGSCWQMDLTRAYDGVRSVYRTVLHLFPGIVVVLDEADLPQEEPISLRWHTAQSPALLQKNFFSVERQKGALDGAVFSLSPGSTSKLVLRNHAYRAPFDKDRLGEPLEARSEPYIELEQKSTSCRFLSLFAVRKASEPSRQWQAGQDRWSIETKDGLVQVVLDQEKITVSNKSQGIERQIRRV